MKIISKAPTRIDLSGGTLDIWPLYLFLEDAITINVAINLYASATIVPQSSPQISVTSKDLDATELANELATLPIHGKLSLISRLIHHFAPEHGFRMETDCAAPAGSGLGGSSSLAIAVCGALNTFTQKGYSYEDLIAVARDIEAQELQIPTGEQDYYAAAYGGFQGWRFGVQKVSREIYDISLNEINNRLLLFFSGQSRSSGINNWQVFKSYVEGNSNVRETLLDIRNESFNVHHALAQKNWPEAFKSIHNEWIARKKLAPGITTSQIEDLIQFGNENGARTGRVCGAGGGGTLVLLMDPEQQPKLRKLARQKDYRLLEFEAVKEGLQVSTLE
jgi:D-glycero-alpha-D-manno-heptose-7-phosphate kinase